MTIEAIRVWEDKAGRPMVGVGDLSAGGNRLSDALKNLAEVLDENGVYYPQDRAVRLEEQGPRT